MDPDNTIPLYLLAWMQERKGKYKKALELYQKADPNPFEPMPTVKLLILKRKIEEKD